jgi:hypothetical protein
MKTKKGGGLPDVLIPLGLIVARGAVPKIVRSLKRRLTKKGGRKRRRTVRKKNKKKTRRSRRQRGGSIESDIEAIYRDAEATDDMIKNDIDHMKKHYPGQLSVLLKYAKESVSDALENTTISLEAKSPKSPKRKKKRKRTKGKRTKGKRTKGKRKKSKGKKKKKTKRKQKGGFMRGVTRDFCQIKN